MMHVVIDLGKIHSCLVCWEQGNSMEETCISVKIPGVAAFQSSAGTPGWERRHLREYMAFIYREYLIPSRLIIESAALVVPDIFGLAGRRTLLDLLEEIFGLYEAAIIPHPLALTAGVQLSLQSSLSGDILLIEPQESAYNCAFLSIIDNVGLTLEKQFTGSWADIMPMAELQGYYSERGWNLDHLILAGIDNQDPGAAIFISSLPPAVNIILNHNPGFTAAEGLSNMKDTKNSLSPQPFNVICPYEYYLGKKGSANLERIPFDMTNLELNCTGRYTLARLQSITANIDMSDERASFSIYEFNTADCAQIKNLKCLPAPVFELDSPVSDLPFDFDLSLNMASATIQLDTASAMTEESSYSPEILDRKLAATQQKLLEWLNRSEQNESLTTKWNNISQPHDQIPSLSAQIDQTLFHLNGLLQLWHNR